MIIAVCVLVILVFNGFSFKFPFQGVQGAAEVVITEMTVEIGIPLEGVTLAVLGTGITVEVLTTDQIKPLAQIHRTEAMGEVTAAPTASAVAATMVMDSPTSTANRDPSEPKTISSLHSSPLLRAPHRMAQVTPLFPSPRHRLRSIPPHRWCPTQCLLSSLSKIHKHLKEVIYAFLTCF